MHPFLLRVRNNPKHFALLFLTAPLIYGLIIPFTIADLSGTLYQQVCFRVYGIPRVRRRQYVLLDRARLAHLNLFQKFNCLYCEYANGVIGYVAEITARTEWYWCPIKHATTPPSPHAHYDRFLGYTESDNFRAKLKEARRACKGCTGESAP